MNGLDKQDLCQYIVSHIRPKEHAGIASLIPAAIAHFAEADLEWMRLFGVLDASGTPGENDYDEDEAFEFILDSYLSDHPLDEDESMLIAVLLDSYMPLRDEYFESRGFSVD